MSLKKVIAVDIDDVLSVNVPAFVEFSNKRWGMNLTVEDYSENWMSTWEVDAKELAERRKIIRKEFWHTLEHSREALPVLENLAGKYKLVITTSRRREVGEATRSWIEKYFSGIFEEIHHSGIFDQDREDSTDYDRAAKATKARLCKEIGADYLIDDHVKHCVGADMVGIKALLFGDYVWNRHLKIPGSVTRVENWHEIGEYFAREGR